MSEDKKVKQTTVRFFEDDLTEIAELAKKLNVPQAELVSEWRKSYERLRLEETTSQGENLKTLRSYTEKIVNLFTSMAEATEENVLSEQNKAIQAENRYTDQILKTNKLKEALEKIIEEQKNEIVELAEKVNEYKEYKESIKEQINKSENQVADKEKIIKDRESTIVSLNDKIQKLEEENKSVDALKLQMARLRSQIEEMKEDKKNTTFDFQTQLQQKDMDQQRKLLSLREELQDKFEIRVEKIYDSENAKREKAREELEKRLREDHRKEVQRIQDEHQKEIQRIRNEHQLELNRIREEINKNNIPEGKLTKADTTISPEKENK